LAYGNEYATFDGYDEKVPYFFPTCRAGEGEGTGWVSPFTQLSHDFGFLPPPPLPPFVPGIWVKYTESFSTFNSFLDIKTQGGFNIFEDFDFY
jgi:hypothetical protein